MLSPKRVILSIRPAFVTDIPDIQRLNQIWLSTGKDSINGFLYGEPFTIADLNSIIQNNEIVVTEKNGAVVGYYLFDNFSDTRELAENKKYARAMLSSNKINTSGLCYRAQAVVDIAHQNLGLSKLMFHALLELTDGKYERLFSAVSKANPKLIAHLKTGWEIIGEDDKTVFVLFSLQAERLKAHEDLRRIRYEACA